MEKQEVFWHRVGLCMIFSGGIAVGVALSGSIFLLMVLVRYLSGGRCDSEDNRCFETDDEAFQRPHRSDFEIRDPADDLDGYDETRHAC